LRDLAKLWFLKLIMTRSNFKKISYDVISVIRIYLVRNYVTEKRHQGKVTRFFNFGPLTIKVFGYASASQLGPSLR